MQTNSNGYNVWWERKAYIHSFFKKSTSIRFKFPHGFEVVQFFHVKLFVLKHWIHNTKHWHGSIRVVKMNVSVIPANKFCSSAIEGDSLSLEIECVCMSEKQFHTNMYNKHIQVERLHGSLGCLNYIELYGISHAEFRRLKESIHKYVDT